MYTLTHSDTLPRSPRCPGQAGPPDTRLSPTKGPSVTAPLLGQSHPCSGVRTRTRGAGTTLPGPLCNSNRCSLQAKGTGGSLGTQPQRCVSLPGLKLLPIYSYFSEIEKSQNIFPS